MKLLKTNRGTGHHVNSVVLRNGLVPYQLISFSNGKQALIDGDNNIIFDGLDVKNALRRIIELTDEPFDPQ